MDYQNDNDCIRNTFGNMDCPDMCSNSQTPYQNMSQFRESLDRMYPDCYRVVYPMVVSACNRVNMPISEEMLDGMTNDIYDRAEASGRINMGMEYRDINSRQFNTFMQERPRRRNRFFRDLIRILILRELLRRRPL